MSVVFLEIGHVLKIHEFMILDHGGSFEIRDMGLLESALAQPSMTFGGEHLHDGLFAMAAAYLFHVVKNHPFVDGNKRTALATALAFLEANGFEIGEPNDQGLYGATMAVVEGRMSKAELAELFAGLASEGG